MRGHIRQRGNKYAFVLDIGYDELGKRKQKWFSGYDTKPKAEKAMREKIIELESGSCVEPSTEYLKDYFDHWLKLKKEQLKPSTYDTYMRMVKNHIKPKIGHIRIDKLKPAHLDKFYGEMKKKNLSAGSIQKTHNIIKTALNQAVAYGNIGRNPALVVKPPRSTQRDIECWDEEQVRTFLDIAREEREFIAFYLALTTGMRQGEILGLKWTDINLEDKKIIIERTISHDGKSFGELKTKTSKRSVILTNGAVEELKKHFLMIKKERIKKGELYENKNLVVCTKNGTQITPRNLTRSWYMLLDKSKLPPIRFHDLRHTHATLLLKQGVHPKIVSERLGHSNVRITLDTYSHLLPGLQEAAAAKFDEFLFGPSKNNDEIKK